MYYVHILKSLKTGEFYKRSFQQLRCYKGITDDIDRRVQQHFAGQNKFTKNRLPLQLTHVEICINRLEARAMEKYFKSGFGRKIIKELDQLSS